MKAKVFVSGLLSFLFGVFVSAFIDVGCRDISLLAILFLLSVLFVYRLKYLAWLLMLLASFSFGIGAYQFQNTYYLEQNKKVANKNIIIKAVVDEIPVKTEHGYMAKIATLSVNEQNNSSKMLAYFSKENSPDFNDIIEFESKVKEYKSEKVGYLIKQKVVGEIDTREYQVVGKNQKISLKSMLFTVRQKFNQAISRSLPGDEANLARGLILGEKANFDARTTRNMKAAGVTHIVALSGYNITIILSLLVFMKRRYSRLVNLIVPLALIIFFVIMTGASASIVRAGIMGFMPILARFLYRPQNSIIAVIFSAFVMVMLNPFILMHDIGFQLSFMALMGLMFLSPIIKGWFSKENILVNLFAETLGAQIAVLPLLVYNFGNVSLISPVSNVFILVFVPLGMFVSFLVGLAGMINSLLGFLVSIPSFLLLKFINQLIKLFGELPFSLVQHELNDPWWILIFYLVLINILIFTKKGQRPPHHEDGAGAL